MDKKESSTGLHILAVVLLATVLAYGVSFYVKRASDLSRAITPEQLASFKLDSVEYKEHVLASKEEPVSSLVETQAQRARYNDVGAAIKSATINNITTLTEEDLTNIGATPWSLTNTIKNNLKYPQIIEVIFNNDNVVSAFLSRDDVFSVTDNYLTLVNLIRDNDTSINTFILDSSFQDTIKDDNILNAVASSSLMQQIILSRAGQYFLKNPEVSKTLIQNNKTLSPLLDNVNLKNAFLSNPATRDFGIKVFN